MSQATLNQGSVINTNTHGELCWVVVFAEILHKKG